MLSPAAVSLAVLEVAMGITLIGSEKGGPGKTTIATNLSALAAISGKSVLLSDSDKQGNATGWASIRSRDPNLVSLICMSKLGMTAGYDLVKLRDKFDEIIVDAAGADSLELRSIMTIADRMIIPTRASPFDVWQFATLARLTMDARAQGNESLTPLVCVNLASTNVSLASEALGTLALLKEFEGILKPAITIIHERVSYRRAARDGCGVMELDEGDNEKAKAEIQYLYDEAFS